MIIARSLLVGFFCVLFAHSQVHAATYQADIVVIGGSLGAPAATLAAARTYPSAQILLVEPTDWLGGQATSQGVSAIDNPYHIPAGPLMRDYPSLYYPADYLSWLNMLRNKPAAAPGTGMGPNGTSWVSRESFDPRTAAWCLDQMVAAYPNVTVLKMTVTKQVATVPANDAHGNAARITDLTLIQRTPVVGYKPFDKFLSQEMPDWYTATDSADFTKQVHTVTPRDVVRGLVVIDASETGDAIVLSGATYTVGRELTSETLGEDGSLPAMNESGSQATVFPFCMTDGTTDPESSMKTPWADFDSYYATQSGSYFGFGSYSWPRVWTYRRLKCAGSPGLFDNVYAGDVSMQNWMPGNDYPYGSIYLSKSALAPQLADWRGGLDLTQVSRAEEHATAFYFFMKANRTTTWDTHLLRGSDAMNMMDTATGLAKFPYIRCGRRIVGLSNFRLMQRYFVPAETPGKPTSFRFYDSVGIGNYPCDVHAIQGSTGISPTVSRPGPFYIPYRALGSANVRNLLAGGKNFAATYASNSAYRLHPIEWATGSAAGTAAALMSRDSRTNIAMLDLAALRELQTAVSANSPIHWAAFDAQTTPPQNGDLVLNDLKSVPVRSPFRAEIYHHSATLARMFRAGTFVGQTTTRANGRLVLEGLTALSVGSTTFTAECYDETNTVIDQLQATIDVTSATPVAGSIVDDTDASFSLTLGSWTNAAAQPDRWATSYKYANSSGSASTVSRSATWRLPIPLAGTYEVFTWYPAAYNRVTDAPFTIYSNGGGSSTTVRINQQTNSGRWVSLGTYSFTGGSDAERVVLTNACDSSATLLVLADAVGVSPISVVPVELSAFAIE